VNHATYEDKDAPMRDMTLSQWNNTITTNLTSTFLVIRAFLRQLDGQSEEAKRSVAIVLIGSTAGKYGEAGKHGIISLANIRLSNKGMGFPSLNTVRAGHADYAATKSAMMGGIMLSLKNEIVKIAPRGRVNCISPGRILLEA